MPRKAADFKVSDDVYEELEKQDLDNAFDPSRPRPYRTIEEMATESTVLRLKMLHALSVIEFAAIQFHIISFFYFHGNLSLLLSFCISPQISIS